MSSVSPSLVEAAARALAVADGTYADGTPGTDWEDWRVEAEAVVAAVGDALRLEGREAAQFEACGITDADVYAAHERGRLEGAQAEHARIEKALRYALRTRGPLGDEPCLAAVLDVLGVHPEASDG